MFHRPMEDSVILSGDVNVLNLAIRYGTVALPILLFEACVLLEGGQAGRSVVCEVKDETPPSRLLPLRSDR